MLLASLASCTAANDIWGGLPSQCEFRIMQLNLPDAVALPSLGAGASTSLLLLCTARGTPRLRVSISWLHNVRLCCDLQHQLLQGLPGMGSSITATP